MENLRLVKPTTRLRSQYLDMISEWEENGEDLIPWSLGLDTRDFDLMVEKLNGYSLGIGLPDGFVELSTFWLINEKYKVIGAIDIRHRLTEYLAFRGGHIGYGIRPSERRKIYATRMLELALEECQALGLRELLITCSKNNLASSKTIVNNGGILESEAVDKGEVFLRYWIRLI